MHRQERIRRDHVHVVGLHRFSRSGRRHGHRRFLPQNLGQQALMLRVQVLHDDEGHAGGGERAKKLNQGVKASGGGANSHDKPGRLDIAV